MLSKLTYVIAMSDHTQMDELLKAFSGIKYDINRSIQELRDQVHWKDIISGSDVIKGITNGDQYEIIGINIGLYNRIKELHDKVDALRRETGKSISRLEFYYKDSIREKHGYVIDFEDDLTHIEDSLFHSTIDYIKRIHSFRVDQVVFHKRIDGIEFDCIATGGTYMDRFARTIGIEFKDSDIEKVVSQAVVRSGYTNVQYVVARTSFNYLIEHAPTLIDDLKKHKIGLILLLNDDIPALVLKAEVKRKTKNKTLEEYFNGQED